MTFRASSGGWGRSPGRMGSAGYTLGPERLTNGSFDDGSTGWTVAGMDATHIATFSAGTLRYQSDTTSPILIVSQANAFVIGKRYQVTFDVGVETSGSLKFDGFLGSPAIPPGTGIKIITGTAIGTPINIYRNSPNVDITLNSVSVKEIL